MSRKRRHAAAVLSVSLVAALAVAGAHAQFIAAHIAARLTPTATARESSADANGRLVGEAGSYIAGCVYNCMWVRYHVSYRNLTGSPTRIAIATRSGVWHGLCAGDQCPRGRSGALHGRFDLPEASFRTFAFPEPAYVEIRTRRYPRGELRGRIEQT